MQKRIFRWLEREFVALSGEGVAGAAASDQAAGIFARFDDSLIGHGLSLADTVRTRLWGRDRAARDAGSAVRSEILTGTARAAGSSYIAPDRFESAAAVALDLVALRPGPADGQKSLKEYDPPRTPLRYLVRGPVVVLSGVSSGRTSLADQVAEVLADIAGSLADAGTSWRHAALVSFYLHRSQQIAELDGLFAGAVDALCPNREYVFVEGYSLPGKLIEIEVTASLPR